MNNYKIYQWGPLLLRQEVHPSVTQLFLDNIRNTTKLDLKTFVTSTDRGAYGDDLGVKDSLKPYIENYLKMLNPKNSGFIMETTWVNIYKNGDFVTPHVHGEGDLSFALFLKLPYIDEINNLKGEGNIVFRYGEKEDIRSKTPNLNQHVISPKMNELYIFPNNLLHYTIPIQNLKEPRISVSGNITIK